MEGRNMFLLATGILFTGQKLVIQGEGRSSTHKERDKTWLVKGMVSCIFKTHFIAKPKDCTQNKSDCNLTPWNCTTGRLSLEEVLNFWYKAPKSWFYIKRFISSLSLNILFSTSSCVGTHGCVGKYTWWNSKMVWIIMASSWKCTANPWQFLIKATSHNYSSTWSQFLGQLG